MFFNIGERLKEKGLYCSLTGYKNKINFLERTNKSSPIKYKNIHKFVSYISLRLFYILLKVLYR
ncbi:hypothetical protein DRN58_06355 [Thermococci archaeon]|nr:MAG: hypothetical protein DRN58_06355 [Thermococci archaeon]